jgi:hypothetical protein
MPRKVYRPTFAQTIWLLVVGVGAISAALYVRYRLIEASAVGLACDAGAQSWECSVRKGASAMFNNSLFGYGAIVVSILNLVRPSVVLLTCGLLAGGAGVVLYNGALSGLALALLILSLARPEPEPQ